jgi:Spy/CpxP family protein refolding chaperone
MAQTEMKDKKEQIKAMKVAYITSELNLNSDEAAKFWPVYNAFDEKQFKLKHEKMQMYKNKLENNVSEQMSDKEASVLLAQMEKTEDELYQLRKKFNTDVKSVLSPVKILKLKKAEEEFNRKLLKQYRNKGPKN